MNSLTHIGIVFNVVIMLIIRARAPLRLGLAGGGTDVSPYCGVHRGYVLNATLDRYAYTVIKTFDEPLVRFVAGDQQIETVQAVSNAFALNGELNLHKAVYNPHFPRVCNFLEINGLKNEKFMSNKV